MIIFTIFIQKLYHIFVYSLSMLYGHLSVGLRNILRRFRIILMILGKLCLLSILIIVLLMLADALLLMA